MFVNECIEGQAIAPARGEVAHVDIGITGRLHLTPQQQCVLGGLGLAAVSLLDGNVLNLVAATCSRQHLDVCVLCFYENAHCTFTTT